MSRSLRPYVQAIGELYTLVENPVGYTRPVETVPRSMMNHHPQPAIIVPDSPVRKTKRHR